MREYYRIGEIASLYGIGTDSLRYYEEIGILCPKRAENGYRMYSITDIWKLNIIRELRKIGFSMEEIKKHLTHYELKDTVALFEKEIGHIRRQKEELSRLEEELHERLSEIRENMKSEDTGSIRRVELAARRVLILNEDVNRDEDVDFLIKKLQKKHEDTLYIIGNGCLGGMIPMDRIREGKYGFYNSVFYEVSDGEESDFVIPGGTYYSVVYRGGYHQTLGYLQQIIMEAERDEMVPDGNAIELWRIDNHETGNQEEYVTELQVRCSPSENRLVRSVQGMEVRNPI